VGWRTIKDLGGRITEGARDGSSLLLYRPSDLDAGLLNPDRLQMLRAPDVAARAIAPGDVMVGKHVPVGVAWITPAAPRHAPDANCLRVVGLKPTVGLWVAAVLGHEAFASTVRHRAAGLALPRLGARELVAIPLPEPPPEVAALAELWRQAADGRLEAQRDLAELVAEVEDLTDQLAPDLPDLSRSTWVAPELIPETWAPDQAALLRYQADLAHRGWVQLSNFLTHGPSRLREHLPSVRVLTLSDGQGEFGFRVPDLREVSGAIFRVYSDPLRSGEVLLSTLGSCPKVVFNHPPAATTIWLVDQWARLDGRAHPGALALLLSTRRVAWQLARATTGAVRQFIGRGDLAAIRIPAIPNATAMSLHRRLADALERRGAADGKLQALRTQLNEHVRRSLGVPA
jgi:hypothetical protein